MFAFLGLSALLLGSCVTEIFKGDELPGGKANTLSVYVTANSLDVEYAKTRSSVAPQPGEDQIGDLYLLFFEADPGRNGSFVDYVKIEGPLMMHTRFDINLMDTDIDVLDAYNVLAIANIDGVAGNRYLNNMSVESWMFQWATKTERDVMREALAWTTTGFAIQPSGLLMNGRVEKAHSQFHLNLILTRNQVRFDVLNGVKDGYDLVGVQIHNAYPASSIWNSGEMDFTNRVGRIPMYYGYTNPNPQSDIMGGLYAFENQVPMPVQNDNFTTTLLILLRDRTTLEEGWFRANITPTEGAQILKRNNVYRLTINNVGGPGHTTWQEAYDDPNPTELDYVINYWDLDNSGVIVQDGSSILSIPSRTVRIGRAGGISTHQIFVFTNSTNPVSPLSIRSQSYTPANNQTSATLSGNVLTIIATALDESELERLGTITLGFAGLEATVNVIQSGIADNFLKVHLPSGANIPRFAPFAGIASDWIRVEASGDWTAEIFTDAPDGFSFGGTSLGVIRNVISSAEPADAALINNNRFQIFTYSANPDATVREAFIVVTLDDDPEHHAVVFRISQAPAGGISVVPNQTTVTFNGAGTGLAAVPNNTTTTFNVRPSEIVNPDDSVTIAEWDWELLPAGSDSYFSVTDIHSLTDPADNSLTVSAVGMNLAGSQRTATLRIFLVANPSTFVDIRLVQQPMSINLSPNTVPAVGYVGGRTQPISVVGDASLQWSAAIVTNGGTAGDGRTLVQHEAKLFIQGGGEVDPLATYSMATQFYVAFPKVYYPNRQITISADVTVTVAGMTQTIRVTQNPLMPNNMTSFNIIGSSQNWGALGNTYNQAWDAALATIPGYSRLSTNGNLTTTSVNPTVSYLHVVPQQGNAAATNWNWAVVHDFINVRDGFVVIAQQSSALNAVNNSNSPIRMAGYNNLVYGVNSNNVQITETHSSQTKVYQFLMERGNRPLTAAQVQSFHNDGINTVIPGPWPASAVIMMTKTSNDNQAQLIIDPENRFLYIGESQIFWNSSNVSGNRQIFLDNLMFYVGNASKYGSHFTDLFIEDGRTNSQPAPWDDWWGANRMSANGVPSK